MWAEVQQLKYKRQLLSLDLSPQVSGCWRFLGFPAWSSPMWKSHTSRAMFLVSGRPLATIDGVKTYGTRSAGESPQFKKDLSGVTRYNYNMPTSLKICQQPS